MRDFTPDMYVSLLKAAQANGYRLCAYRDFIASGDGEKRMVLRHDVDARPENSLHLAQLEADIGAKGTYYFRCVKQSFEVPVILKIKELGHEIGYHYEDLALCGGNYEKAYEHFCFQLERFRKLARIETICMHGSPLSRWDNRALWKKYDYRSLGILAEPYFDTDFSKVLYLSDTGRKWSHTSASIRDKVQGLSADVSSTADIIRLIQNNQLASQVMLNIHPQRWTSSSFLWYQELISQNLKNIVKSFLAARRPLKNPS